jgi:hypothetical protein
MRLTRLLIFPSTLIIPYHKLILLCYGAQTFFQVLNRAQSQAIPIPSTTQEMQMLNQETTTFVEV